MDITAPTLLFRPTNQSGPRRLHRLLVTTALALLLTVLVLPARPASADVTFSQRVLELVNRDRTANGLQPLVADATLSATAQDAPYNGCGFTVAGRAKDMGERNYFSHTVLGCATQNVFDLLNATGLVYSGAGENIGWMNATTDPVVAAENIYSQWMNSPDHRANILNASFTKIGIGSWSSAPGQTWSGGGYALPNVWIGVQIFAGGPVSPTTTTPPTTTPPAVPTGRFTPLTPARILDTRDGTGGVSGAVPQGGTVDVQIAGRGGIPSSDVAGVALTVTVTQPTQAGYLTMYPSGTARPLAANLNFVAGETVSNLVVVKVGANGEVSIYNPAGATHVVADVAGWYSGTGTGSAGRFQPIQPSRIMDTRTGLGGSARLAPGASVDLQVAGQGGIPSSGVQAAVLNVTVTGTAGAGFLTTYASGEPKPGAASLTFAAGNTVGARTMVKLGAGGRVTIYNGSLGATDVVVDAGGWYTDASVAGTLGAFMPVNPVRILDTRDGTGGIVGFRPAQSTVDVQITGVGGVPASGARAVILNATVTQPDSDGYLTIFPAGTARPLASDLNFSAGETQPNLVVVQLGSGGKVSLFTSAGAHVIFDVAGWIS